MGRWLPILLLAMLAIFSRPLRGQTDSEKALIPQLIAALGDVNVRQGSAVVLAKQGGAAVPALRAALTSSEPDVRVWSAFVLGQIGPPANAAIHDLKKSLIDDDEALRRAAAVSLGKIGATNAVDELARALGDEHLQVRLKAAVALGRIGPPAAPATRDLLAVLSNHDVRTTAREALMQIGPSITELIVDRLSEDNIRFDILFVLRKVDPTKARQLGLAEPSEADLHSLQLVLNDMTRSVADRSTAATSLTSLGNEGFGVLIKAFERPDTSRTAATAFRHADPSASRLLIDALTNDGPHVRAAAADAIGHIGPEAGDAAAELIRLLQDKDRDVRYHAVRALHELGPAAKPAVTALTAVIIDSKEAEPTRQWAIKTLVVTLPDTRELVVKALIEASSEEINYGVRQLARQQVLKFAPAEAKAAGIK